jgi:hypothetical protein
MFDTIPVGELTIAGGTAYNRLVSGDYILAPAYRVNKDGSRTLIEMSIVPAPKEDTQKHE